MKIGDRLISKDVAPLVIAEIGINHNGSLETAMEMVHAAYIAGAECIKHQTHIVDEEMSSAAKQVIPGNATTSIYDIMARCALNEEDEITLKNYVESLGMIFLSTPFSIAAANRLERMGVVAYKIGSGECNNLPLIEHVAAFGKPMIISTGMNSLLSIRTTVDILMRRSVDFALLHCTNVYPTPARLIRLGAMKQMMIAFPCTNIGLSDHSINNNACLAATALGATILERHFTDSKRRPGEDIVCSMDPCELSALITGSAEIAEMRGGLKYAVDEEQPCINFAFATVVTSRPILKGELFCKDNICVKRPGSGDFLAEEFYSILDTHAMVDIPADTHLMREHVAK